MKSRDLALAAVVERTYAPAREAMLAALRVVLMMPRSSPGARQERPHD